MPSPWETEAGGPTWVELSVKTLKNLKGNGKWSDK